MLEASPALTALASQIQTSTRSICHQTALPIRYIALDETDGAALFQNTAHCPQAGFPDRFQEVNFKFQGRERFTFTKICRVGNTHSCVSDVTKDTSVKCPHWISMRLTGFKFNHRFARLNGSQIKADQAGNGWWRNISPYKLLKTIQHLCHKHFRQQ